MIEQNLVKPKAKIGLSFFLINLRFDHVFSMFLFFAIMNEWIFVMSHSSCISMSIMDIMFVCTVPFVSFIMNISPVSQFVSLIGLFCSIGFIPLISCIKLIMMISSCVNSNRGLFFSLLALRQRLVFLVQTNFVLVFHFLLQLFLFLLISFFLSESFFGLINQIVIDFV